VKFRTVDPPEALRDCRGWERHELPRGSAEVTRSAALRSITTVSNRKVSGNENQRNCQKKRAWFTAIGIRRATALARSPNWMRCCRDDCPWQLPEPRTRRRRPRRCTAPDHRKSPHRRAGLSLGHHAWACRGGGNPPAQHRAEPLVSVSGSRLSAAHSPHEKVPQRMEASGAKWHQKGVRRVRRTRRYNNDCGAQKKPRHGNCAYFPKGACRLAEHQQRRITGNGALALAASQRGNVKPSRWFLCRRLDSGEGICAEAARVGCTMPG
jgi:hypothetical protein